MRPEPVSARNEAIEWARGVAMRPDTVYLDTETTGIGPEAEIIDIAIIGHDGRLLFESLVRPGGPIPAGAIAIHGIVDEMVAGMPRWSAVYPKVASILRQAGRVVIYNAEFDTGLIAQDTLRHGLRQVSFRSECAMLRYSSFAGVWNDRFGNWRWHKLDQAAQQFGAVIDGHHRALFDARLCRAVVQGMAAQSLVTAGANRY